MSEITDSEQVPNSNAPTNAVHEFHDGEGDGLGYTIASTVAAVRGTDPLSLPPLYDCIDVDALEALFEGSRGRRSNAIGSVSFVYAGYDVTVDFDGWIRITPTSDI